MIKRRKIFQRAAALLCCMILLPSLFIFSVSADTEDGFFDVLQYGTANGSGTQVVSGAAPFTVVYETAKIPFFYIDTIVVSPNVVNLEYNGVPLERKLIGSSTVNGAYFWRFYGTLAGDASGYLQLVVSHATPGTNVSVIFEQLRVSPTTYQQSIFPTVGTVLASPYQWVPSEAMPDANTPATITFKERNVSFAEPFYSTITLSDWKDYDYLDVYLSLRCTAINYIAVLFDSLSIPYTLNYLDSNPLPDNSWGSDGAFPADNGYYCVMRIDLTGVKRTVNSDVVIRIEGNYMPYVGAQGITLQCVTGIIVGTVPSDTATFWQRLQGLLIALFGSDPAAANANQQQQEYHNESQDIVIDAVANWDANIDYAEEGFASSIQFVTPSVGWMSLLATKVYNNLGVFRSLYLLAGLMSVIMLLLSKSGVAAKIGRSGRSSGGGKKDA